MRFKGREDLLSTLDPAELEAQRIACSHLLKGCERALFHFGLIAGETPFAEAAEIDGRAVEIMRSVLDSWRDTLSQLPAQSAPRHSHGNADRFLMTQPIPPASPSERRVV
jgi:hypothetical protein